MFLWLVSLQYNPAIWWMQLLKKILEVKKGFYHSFIYLFILPNKHIGCKDSKQSTSPLHTILGRFYFSKSKKSSSNNKHGLNFPSCKHGFNFPLHSSFSLKCLRNEMLADYICYYWVKCFIWRIVPLSLSFLFGFFTADFIIKLMSTKIGYDQSIILLLFLDWISGEPSLRRIRGKIKICSHFDQLDLPSISRVLYLVGVQKG